MAAPRHDLGRPQPPTPVHGSSPSPKPLTIESLNHLHKFIGHVLEEETGFRDADKHAWVSGIESALNDFAREVDAGTWLSGIRRARVLEQKKRKEQQQQQAAAEAKKREMEHIAKEKETEARNKAKSRPPPPPPTDSVKSSSALAKEADPATVSEAKTEPLSEEAKRNLRALQQLRNLAKTRRPSSSDDQKRARHLLLTVVLPDAPSSPPPASCVATAGDTTVPTCTFTPYVYSLPAPDLFGEDPDDNCETVVNSTLFGFREWDVNLFEAHEDIELIGGTFSLNKVLSANEHASLVRVLRLSTYTLLSLLLEQKFLTSSSIKLNYPKSAPPPISIPPTTVALTHRNSSPDVQVEAKPRKRDILRQGIWSLLHKRLQRSATLDTSDPRGASLDLPRSEPDVPKTPRSSLDGSPTSPLRQRRFSIFGGDRAPPPSPAALVPSEPPPDRAFQCALHRIEESKGMLSASPGLVFPPPQLLVHLAESEKEHPSRHLTGEERTGLTSILGWEGKKAAGRGSLISTAAFLRQQQLSLLYSEHVYGPGRTSEALADGTLNKLVDGDPKQRTYVHCGAPVQWLTYVYYASGNHDQSLGDMVTSMCVQADEPCTQPGCKARRRQHERRWIHGGIRVAVQTEARNPSVSPDLRSEEIEMWQSCKICRKATEQCKMSDGTYLFSFAKFLELLLYSSTICTLSQPLCPHTSPSSPSNTSPSSLPASRFNIIRHFSHKSYQVSFTLSLIDDVFDLRMPRLQFMRDGWVEKTPPVMTSNTIIDDTDKKELRQEIKGWWQAVAEHLDKLEAEFTVSTQPKSLPRLPSDDDAWEGDPPESPSEDPSEEGDGLTPKGLLPVSLPPTPCHSAENSSSSISTIKATPTHSGSDTSFQTINSDDLSDTSSIHFLTNMRFAFQRAEQALYSQLRDTPNSSLNNVRREFQSTARGANKRLAAWEAKHVLKDARPSLAAHREAIQGPHWWNSGFHAVPGGNVVVQEEDWGSIIAFTLSSFDFQRELANLMNPRALRSPIARPHSPPLPATPRQQYTMSSLGRSSASSSTSSFKFFSSSHKPDPDREDSVWDEPEAYSAVVTRKEHPRDPTALLSLREVLRHKVPVDNPQSSPSSSSITVSRMGNNSAPPSAWAKPAVEVNMAAVDGKVTGMPEAVLTAGRILHELDGASVLSSKGSTDSAASEFIETNVHRGKTSSILSRVSLESLDAIGAAPHHAVLGDKDKYVPVPPAQRAAAPPERERANKPGGFLVDPRSRSSTMSTTQDSIDRDRDSEATTNASDSFMLSWTSSLTNAMRYMLKADLPSQPATPPTKNHHGLLYADPMTIDERPHIKYDWTIGKRLKFSCTVYYAKQFDALRRRCGVEDVFVRSMAKCEPWKAQGGKSRSNFWKTSDDRFIIKTLINAWNVADFQVLIDLAPSYFLHMDSTANRASILAKLLGFYTVEVRNLETGTVQAKADLLVMENLFYSQKPTKTFDLKGIQGRKVKASSNSAASKTLFDSEWIEGQQRALTLVNPVSKAILQEATKADCDFLSKSNIMDYSLLLGIDEERKQIHCGLVDTIGSYTFAKTLEYKAKGLSGKEGKNITVVPPHEYQERFVSALDSYFMACPDKWTKPVDETKLIHDPALLPSVL